MSDGGTVLAGLIVITTPSTSGPLQLRLFALCQIPSFNHNRVKSSDQTWTTQHWHIFGNFQFFYSLSLHGPHTDLRPEWIPP